MSKFSIPAFFTSMHPAHSAAGSLLPAPAAATRGAPAAHSGLPAPPMTGTPSRSQPGATFRDSLNTVARKLKSGTDFAGGARKRSHTPFTTRTTSPKLQPAPQLHNSDAPRAQLDDERVAAPPSASAEHHGQATRARLTEKFKENSALQRLADKQAYLGFLNIRLAATSTDKDNGRDVLLRVLEDISRVPGIAGTKMEAMQGIGMICVMEAAMQACGNDAAAAARALSCLRNIDLLASIRNPEPMPASVASPRINCPAADAPGGRQSGFTQRDLALAWKIAQELETTPAGFAALKSLSLHDSTAADAHPDIERHDDMMLHAYLQASREKCAMLAGQGSALSPSPYQVAQSGGTPSTVLDKGIAQIRKHLVASRDHVLHSPQAPFKYVVRPGEHEWAIGFIRNGLYTDEKTTADGKPTLFARIDGRLGKVSTWCERASSGNGAASTAWRKAAPYLLPGYRKSPLNAYNALEAGRGLRKCGVGLENASQGILQDARAFKEHILGNIVKGLKAYGGEGGSPLSTESEGNARDPSAATIRNLVRLALLTETANSAAPFATLLLGAAPDAYTVEQARRRVYAWLAGGEAGQRPETRDAVESALSAATRPLTLHRLQEWAEALPGGPGKKDIAARENPATAVAAVAALAAAANQDPAELAPIQASNAAKPAAGDEKTSLDVRPDNKPDHASDDTSSSESEILDFLRATINEAFEPTASATEVPAYSLPDWEAYEKAVRQVISGLGEPASAPHFGKLGNAPDKLGVIGEGIEHVMARMELGSKLSFASGGFIGAGAKEATRFLSSFASFGLFRPHVDASVIRKREAVLEMETSAGGNQIFVGTRRSLKLQGGGGIGVGPGFKIRGVGGIKAGASLNASAGIENPEMRGVQLRLPRTGGMAGDQANNALLGHLFRKHVIERNSPALKQDPARAPGKDGDSPLKNLLQACPQLAVSMVRNTESIAREGMSAEGGAAASAGPFSVGPSMGISYEARQAKTREWIESKAALNVSKSSQGVQHTVAMTGQIPALLHLPSSMKSPPGEPASPGRLKRAASGLLDAMCVTSTEVGRWGKSASRTLLIENNAVCAGSRGAIVHRDAESFIDSVAPRLDRWAAAVANRFQKEKVNAGDAYRQEAYDRAYAALRAQLEEARNNGDANTQYVECFELTGEALEAANALRSAVTLCERSGDKDRAAAYSKKLEALLASDAAWTNHLLWTQRTTLGQETAGLYFGVYAGKTDAVSSSGIKVLG
ncbi:tetratricopeptide repeat protein [Noviherbaspirillum aerium]|uniref:tetratricopeptide repeat protein n=1 Tax=Noviherbaspirillum aerium TaxID=2588497 RepID=UPI00124D29A8|nr:hypothetical protein [Noviherbaspirillum aerium]